MTAKRKTKQPDNVLTASEQLSSFLKTHKEDHYNYEEEIETKFSTKYPILQACNFRRYRYNDDDGNLFN